MAAISIDEFTINDVVYFLSEYRMPKEGIITSIDNNEESETYGLISVDSAGLVYQLPWFNLTLISDYIKAINSHNWGRSKVISGVYFYSCLKCKVLSISIQNKVKCFIGPSYEYIDPITCDELIIKNIIE